MEGGGLRAGQTPYFFALLCFCLTKGAEGAVFPELDELWGFRSGVGAEVAVGAALLTSVAKKLADIAAQPLWRGQRKFLFINSGRALRLADAMQHHLLFLHTQGVNCTTCFRHIRQCV